MQIQPAVKKETLRVLAMAAGATAVQTFVFLILHLLWPDRIPFDYRVILAGVCGCGVAVLNFFLMGLSVQAVASMEDRDAAAKSMKASYSRRMLMQVAWGIAVVLAPCFQFVAGLLPLLYPSLCIRIRAVVTALRSSQEAAKADDTGSEADSSNE